MQPIKILVEFKTNKNTLFLKISCLYSLLLRHQFSCVKFCAAATKTDHLYSSSSFWSLSNLFLLYQVLFLYIPAQLWLLRYIAGNKTCMQLAPDNFSHRITFLRWLYVHNFLTLSFGIHRPSSLLDVFCWLQYTYTCTTFGASFFINKTNKCSAFNVPAIL